MRHASFSLRLFDTREARLLICGPQGISLLALLPRYIDAQKLCLARMAEGLVVAASVSAVLNH